MPKLNDIQLVLLPAALQREDRSIFHGRDRLPMQATGQQG